VVGLQQAWHKWSGYSKRSMGKNAIYRYKTIIGRCMRSRTLPGQRVEMRIACRVLNTMTRLGMPDSWIPLGQRCEVGYGSG
jgi:hypothetical protein